MATADKIRRLTLFRFNPLIPPPGTPDKVWLYFQAQIEKIILKVW